MATTDQSAFIKDLVLAKFRSFSEFKKWLATTGIVRTNGQIFSKGLNLKEILNRVTPQQASAIITAMEPLADVAYKPAYDQDQIDEVSELIADIGKEVNSWTFIK
jgi:hypothetical protein